MHMKYYRVSPAGLWTAISEICVIHELHIYNKTELYAYELLQSKPGRPLRNTSSIDADEISNRVSPAGL